MTTLSIKAVSLVCMLTMLSISVFGEDARHVRFPVRTLSVSADESLWTPPPPTEHPFVDSISATATRSGLYYTSTVLMAAGGILCAGGIVMMTHGFSDDMNANTMHSGGLLIISGGLVAALFSVISHGSRRTKPEYSSGVSQ